MTSTAKPVTREISDRVREGLDADLSALREGSRAWSGLTLAQRHALLRRVRATTSALVEEWADVAAASKGLDAEHPARGEEWLSGPYAVLTALDAYAETLDALVHGRSPVASARFGTAPGDRTVVHTSPLHAIDALLLSGFTTEVWLRPGVTADDARTRAGLAQRTPDRPGGVGLVLGAGNVTSIPVLDVLSELIAFNRVVLLKVNPTQDALVPVFERALAPLIEPGFLRIVRGSGDIGAHLVQHASIDHVHITGSAATFSSIVWGSGDEAEERRRDARPRLTVPISAELGGVSPIIVIPGPWSDADLRYQAEHVATMRLNNAGHNCVAGQVVIVSAEWSHRNAFLRALRDAYDRAPRRPAWYPGSAERLAAAGTAYPDAVWCAEGDRALFRAAPDGAGVETTEYFAPVLGVVELPGTGQEFLDTAVAHANGQLSGTLGANVLVDPETHAALGAGFERALARLRYGTVAVNAWSAFGFLTPTATWGAFPGGTLEDCPSGIGVVHNALLLDDVERTVVRGPFRPFPRSLASVARTGSGFTVLPTPPWFVSSRTGAAVCEGLTRFRADGDWRGLAITMVKAFGA